MKQVNTFRPTILEGIGFSLLGTLYAGFVFGFIEVFCNDLDNQSGLIADHPSEPTLGWLWIFVGLIFSYFLIRFSLSILSRFSFWLFTIILASSSAVFIQNLYLSFYMMREYSGSPNLVSYSLITNMIVILIPFTVLYANRQFFIYRIRRQNTLS